jgi:hypothetical protein
MKITWGTGIFITILAFVLFMAALVGFVMVKTDVDLVRADYYAAEIDYGRTIKALERGQMLSRQPSTVLTEGGMLVVSFLNQQPDAGTAIRLWRNDKVDADKGYQASSLPLEISTQGMKKGNWNIELTWHVNGEPHMFQGELVLK